MAKYTAKPLQKINQMNICNRWKMEAQAVLTKDNRHQAYRKRESKNNWRKKTLNQLHNYQNKTQKMFKKDNLILIETKFWTRSQVFRE